MTGPARHRTLPYVTGALATAAATGCAARSPRPAAPSQPYARTAPLRRPHSGHLGDYAAWFVPGPAVPGAPAPPGVTLVALF